MVLLKRTLCLLICSMLLIFAGCEGFLTDHKDIYVDNDLYRIYVQDGTHILEPKIQLRPRSDLMMSSVIIFYPRFVTLEKMRQSITDGNIDKYGLYYVQQISSDTSGRFIVCDIHNLYTPICPENMTASVVEWRGINYRFQIDPNFSEVISSTTVNSYISCLDEEYYYNDLKRHTEFGADESLEIKSTSPIPSRTVRFTAAIRVIWAITTSFCIPCPKTARRYM